MGSGKTTLARALAERLRFRYFPESLPALEYLTDLFRDRARWSFDTQVAFLTYKSLQLLRATRDGNDVVLDRSLYEDAEIFARHFFEKAEMDARSYETYKALASHFINAIPCPDIVLECICTSDVAKRRIASRGREHQARYPDGHVEELNDRYKVWREDYSHGPFFTIDGDSVDWRIPSVQERIAKEILGFLAVEDPPQLSLFQTAVAPIAASSAPPLLRLVHGSPSPRATARSRVAAPRREPLSVCILGGAVHWTNVAAAPAPTGAIVPGRPWGHPARPLPLDASSFGPATAHAGYHRVYPAPRRESMGASRTAS